VRVVCVSDTHLFEPELPSGDILIHAGDMTMCGRIDETWRQLPWLSRQVPHFKKVIVVPGNHEIGWEESFNEQHKLFVDAGITLLNDTHLIVDGFKIHGSPVQPWFHDWEFNRERGNDIRKHWLLIPEDTGILITHGPPYEILDRCEDGRRVGCEDLLEFVYKIKPKLHVFGHIHEAYGVYEDQGIKFVNASIMNLSYHPVNSPIVVDID